MTRTEAPAVEIKPSVGLVLENPKPNDCDLNQWVAGVRVMAVLEDAGSGGVSCSGAPSHLPMTRTNTKRWTPLHRLVMVWV